MDILCLSSVHKFLDAVELNRLKMTCRYMQETFDNKYTNYIIRKRLNLSLCDVDNFKNLQYAVVIKETDIIQENNYLLISFNFKFRKKFDYCFDKYLTSIFNYQHPFFYFYYQNNVMMTCKKNIFYYEITFKKKILVENCISVGFSSRYQFDMTVENELMIGWLEDTIAIHTDNGYLYNSGSKVDFISFFEKNSTIGAGNHVDERYLFFTIDGIIRYRWHYTFIHPFLYPCVGGDIPLDIIDVNYGNTPFLFDLTFFS